MSRKDPSAGQDDGPDQSRQGHVLICDDDGELRSLLAGFLRDNGYTVSTAADSREVDRLLRSTAPVDLVILDVMLPGKSGLEICRDLRAASTVPILMLTARGEETDRIVGLEMGADDYMSKPFSPHELLARVKAMLRRSRMLSPTSAERRRSIEFAGWKLDLARRELRNPAGVIIDLSGGEYDLLLAFLDAPQRVLSREQLLESARNREPSAFDRSIDVQVSRLRRKIVSGDEGEGLHQDDPRCGLHVRRRGHLPMKWLRDTIAGRTIIVLVLGLGSIVALAQYLYQTSIEREVTTRNAESVAERLTFMAGSITSLAPERRDEAAHRMSGGPLELHWGREPLGNGRWQSRRLRGPACAID